MELLHAALLFASLSLFFLLFKSKSINLGSTLPPGPTGFPIIGSIHHLLRRWPPHRALRDLAMTHGPLMHLRLGQLPLIVVSSPEIAREIMKTHDAVFATRPQTIATKITSYGGLDLIFAPYGEHWRQLRKLCVLELLSAKRVQSFRSIREEEVCNLVRSIGSMSSSSLPVNISEMISRLTNNITARATLGSRCKDQDRYLEALKEGSRLLSGFMLVDLFPGSTLVRLISRVEHKIERWHRKMDEILDGIVKERRERREMKDGIHGEQTPDNFLDVLLRQQEQGGELGFPITTDIIKAIISDVFAGGTETSSSTMTWAMSELMKNPRVMERAQKEAREVLGRRDRLTEVDTGKLSYLKLIIKETLRLHPAAPLLLPRECMKSCQIQGYNVPPKARVVVNVWAIGRDPRYWEDPEEFKPERFDNNPIDFKGGSFKFIPFGAGRRICPGILFGLTNMELALAHLLYYFDWRLPHGLEPHDLDMTESFGVGVRRKSDLYLYTTPHASFPMA